MAGPWLNAGLPRVPLLTGYTEEPADYRQAFDPEVGPPLTRRASTAIRTTVTVTYRMTAAQMHAFRAFWRARQAEEFLMPDPLFRPDWGEADEVTARFLAAPRIVAVTPGGTVWDVSMQLLVSR